MGGPIVCVVAYPSTNKDGQPTRFDMDYYLKVHMANIDKYWSPFGMKNWEITVYKPEDSLDGSTPPYCVQATIYWDNVEDLKNALANASDEPKKDIPIYTDVEPVLWVSRVQAVGGNV